MYKYIILRVGGRDVPIIFPDHLVHSLVVDAMKQYYIKEARELGREWGPITPVAAGSVDLTVESCHGESTTLNLKPRENDAAYLQYGGYLGWMADKEK